MKKIAKTSLAVLALMSMGVMNASAKTLKASDIAGLTEDPVYIRGNSAFIGKLTTTDMLHSFRYDGNMDPMLYLKVGSSWIYADTGKAIPKDEVEKLTFDITRIVGEKTGDHISENTSVYTDDKYGYRVNKDTVYDQDDSRTAEYFVSAKESSADEAMESIFLNDDNVKTSFDSETKLATVTLKDGAKLSTIKDIINGFGEVLKTNSYTSIELVYNDTVIPLTEVMVNTDEENEELTTKVSTLLATMLGTAVNGEDTDISNLFNKSFKVRFNTTDGEGKTVSTEYEVKFYTDVDTNTYFVEGTDEITVNRKKYNAYTLTCRSNGDEKCTPVINVLDAGKTQTISSIKFLADSIAAAINSGKVASVDLSTVSTDSSNKTYSTAPDNATITNWIKSAIGNGTPKYTDLAGLESLTIKFNLKEGVNSIYGDGADSYTYTISIGQYVDIDGIIDGIIEANNVSNLGSFTDFNSHYHLDRVANDNNKLVFDVNLSNNSLHKFSDALSGFDGILGTALTSTDISAITIGDQEFTAENVAGQSLKKILKAVTGSSKLIANDITNLVLDVTFKTASNKHLMPGTLNAVVGDDGDQVSYQLSFNMNNFNVDNIFVYLTDTEADNKHFTYAIDYDNNVITAKLTNISDSLDDVDITKSLGLLDTFGNFVKEVQINNKSIPLAQADAKQQIADAIATVVAAKGAETVADLTTIEEGISIKLVLADNVYTGAFTYGDEGAFVAGTNTEDSYAYTLKFDSSASNVTITESNKNSIDELIKAGAEKITLSPSTSLGSGIKIENVTNGLEIVGNGAQVTGKIEVADSADNISISDIKVVGDVEVSGNDVTISDSEITGDVTTKGSANEVTIEDTTITGEVIAEANTKVSIIGDTTKDENGNITSSTTTINGAVTVKSDSFSMDGVVVKGTDAKVAAADDGSNKIAVIDADAADGLTIKNSRIEYNGNKTLTGETKDTISSYVYSLVYTTGTVDLEGNTFDITNVKNPIEFVYNSQKPAKDGTVISDNHFVGNNYVDNESHNVISIYGAADNNATITIERNTFEYASSVLRITDTTKKNVTYEVNGNIVTSNSKGTAEKTSTLIVVRTNNSAKDLSHITINAKHNKLGEVDWSSDKLVSILDNSGTSTGYTGKLNLNGSQYPTGE